MESPDRENPLLTGLGPVHDASARVLVLGSMPGVRSLEAQAYYAHPRNAFWSIMADILEMPRSRTYDQRLARLRERGVALWDVIGKCRRPGSLDQKVEKDSIVANDFEWLLDESPELALVAFNGHLAEQSFRRYVLPALSARASKIGQVRLPSTSPAHAALNFEQKRDAWAQALRPVLQSSRSA